MMPRTVGQNLLSWMLHLLFASALLGNACAAEPPVTALAFSPKGDSLLVASQRGVAVRSWPEFEFQRELEVSLVNVHCLAFSPDGTRLAIAGGTPGQEGIIELLDWPSGKLHRRMGDHDDVVYGVSWSEDSKQFAAGAFDSQVSLWNALQGEPMQRLTGHSRGVTSVALLPGAEQVISVGYDQSLRVWDLASGKVVRTSNNHTAAIHAVALRPAASELPMVASASDDRTVRFWQPTIGRLVRFRRLDSVPLALAWLPDSSRIAVTTDDGKLMVVDANDARLVEQHAVCQSWAYCLAIQPGGREVAVGGRDGKVYRVTLAQTASSE